jgi:hypothetical protein
MEDGEALLAVFLATAEPKDSASAMLLILPTPAPGRSRIDLAPATHPRTLLWFLDSRTGQQVKRPAVGAEGFVLDHFSRAAVEHHLRDVADPLLASFGDLPPYSVFSDSLEVYGSDWTPHLLAEFKQRRGYDLLPHLPELVSGTDDEALSVRHDWGLTLTELIDENYLKPIEGWAAAHHTLFRSQTYGDPAVSLSSNALVEALFLHALGHLRQPSLRPPGHLGRDLDLARLARLPGDATRYEGRGGPLFPRGRQPVRRTRLALLAALGRRAGLALLRGRRLQHAQSVVVRHA